MCLHIPFSKQGLKGLQAIAQDEETLSRLTERFQEAIVYNKVVGKHLHWLYLPLSSFPFGK